MAVEKPKTSKTSKKQSGVMDVSNPGKVAPSASSRPIIVGHRPTVQDPMVNEDKTMPSNESEEHKIDVKRTAPKVIAPLSPSEDLSAEEPKSTEPDTEENLPTEAVEPIADDATETEPEEPESTDEEATDSEPTETSAEEPDAEPKQSAAKDKGSSIVDAVAGNAAKGKDKKLEKQNEELKKRLAEVEKLVEDKKYFVKTSSTTKKERKTRWAMLILAVLLLVAGYLAIDAQLVKNDYWLPYHFFKEDKKSDTLNDPAPSQSSANDKNADQSEALEDYTGEIIESPKKAFKVKIPDGWKIILVEDSDMLFSEFRGDGANVFTDALKYDSGTKPMVARMQMLGVDAPIRFSINYHELDTSSEVVDDTFTKSEFTTSAGIKGLRYFKQLPLDMDSEPGPSPAEKRYVYEFKNATKKFYITYRILEKTPGKEDGLAQSDENRLELMEQVVKTLEI